MEPFDLEAAKRGEQIVTRDGREAKFIAHVPEATSVYRVIVLVQNIIFHVTSSGLHGDTRSPSDMFMAPKKRTVWVNFYRTGHTTRHFTQAEADYRAISEDRINNKAFTVEIEL